MTDRERIHEMACLLRSAHCTLDRLASDHLKMGGREVVEALCQHIRNSYVSAFETLKADSEVGNA